MEWNVEELKLYNQKGRMYGRTKIYNCESELSREEKIAFVDKMQDGKLSYLLDLIEKFNKDKENLPKGTYDIVKTVSLKAWINKNDTKYERKMIDNEFTYGKIRFLGLDRNIMTNDARPYDTHEDIVDEAFHRQLVKLEEEERIYFLEHDEYSILKEKFRNRNYGTTFGVKIGTWSSGKICVCDESDNEREITIDELKELLAKYEELDKLVEKLTLETNIKY